MIQQQGLPQANFVLQLPEPIVNLVIAGLAKLPYEVSAQAIELIAGQVRAQVMAQAEAQQRAAAAANGDTAGGSSDAAA